MSVDASITHSIRCCVKRLAGTVEGIDTRYSVAQPSLMAARYVSVSSRTTTKNCGVRCCISAAVAAAGAAAAAVDDTALGILLIKKIIIIIIID